MYLSNNNTIGNEEIISNSIREYMYEKSEEISIVVLEDLKEDIIITNGIFNAEVKYLDKLIGLENRDIFIFHLEVFIGIEYMEKSNSNNIKILKRNILTSRIVEIKPSNNKNLLLSGDVFVIEGVVSHYNNILYSTVLLSLTLGSEDMC